MFSLCFTFVLCQLFYRLPCLQAVQKHIYSPDLKPSGSLLCLFVIFFLLFGALRKFFVIFQDDSFCPVVFHDVVDEFKKRFIRQNISLAMEDIVHQSLKCFRPVIFAAMVEHKATIHLIDFPEAKLCANEQGIRYGMRSLFRLQ